MKLIQRLRDPVVIVLVFVLSVDIFLLRHFLWLRSAIAHMQVLTAKRVVPRNLASLKGLTAEGTAIDPAIAPGVKWIVLIAVGSADGARQVADRPKQIEMAADLARELKRDDMLVFAHAESAEDASTLAAAGLTTFNAINESAASALAFYPQRPAVFVMDRDLFVGRIFGMDDVRKAAEQLRGITTPRPRKASPKG